MAILDGAKLHRAFLSNTKRKGASFRKTVFSETVFVGVDLSKAKNLATCVHRSPSVLDHRTLLRSRQLPLKFLQGCGLPDNFIDALGDRLILKQYCSCFISYSSRDQTFANRLYADLQANGVRCWFAPKDMPFGAKLRESIDEAISENDKMLLVLSKNSIASSWVEKEFETSFEEECRREDTVLFPIMLDHSPFESRESWIADIRRTRNIGDFSRWMDDVPYKEAFDRLLRALQRN